MSEVTYENGLTMEKCFCPLCGSESSRDVFRAEDHFDSAPQWNGQSFQYVVCTHCGLYYLNPRPNQVCMMEYYDENYISHTPSSDVTAGVNPVAPIINVDNREVISFISMIKEWLYLNRWGNSSGASGKKRMLISFLKWFKIIYSNPLFFHGRNRLTIDYGCGIGKFAGEMKSNGWVSFGFDLSYRAVVMAKEMSRLTVGVSNAENIPIKDGSLDLVTMHHALEHFYDPVAIIKGVARTLKPYGTLMISIPSAHSFAILIEKGYWIGADAPRHLTIWTPSSIERLLKKNGFTIDWMYNASSTSAFTGGMEYLLKKWGINVKRDRIRKNWFLRKIFQPLVTLLDKMSYGDNLCVIATKEPLDRVSNHAVNLNSDA